MLNPTNETERDLIMNVRAEYLAHWLIDNGYAEAKRGYGHVTGEDLAKAILKEYVVSFRDDKED